MVFKKHENRILVLAKKPTYEEIKYSDKKSFGSTQPILKFKLFFIGNSSMDTYDGGTSTAWIWACCTSLIRDIQES